MAARKGASVYRTMFNENAARVRKLAGEGLSMNQIARSFGVYDHSLRAWLEFQEPELKAQIIASGRRRAESQYNNFAAINKGLKK